MEQPEQRYQGGVLLQRLAPGLAAPAKAGCSSRRRRRTEILNLILCAAATQVHTCAAALPSAAQHAGPFRTPAAAGCLSPDSQQ
jgi:hypothetical protein